MNMLTARRRGRRGAAMLWFLLIALPILLLSAGLATEVTRVIIANRQVSNATEAAAVAGAQQFRYVDITPCAYQPCRRYTLDLDVPRAQLYAAYTILNGAKKDDGFNTMSSATQISVSTPQVLPFGGVQQVSVSTSYTVKGLVFLTAAARLLGDTAPNVGRYTVTRTATVCASSKPVANSTNGFCTRPTK